MFVGAVCKHLKNLSNESVDQPAANNQPPDPLHPPAPPPYTHQHPPAPPPCTHQHLHPTPIAPRSGTASLLTLSPIPVALVTPSHTWAQQPRTTSRPVFPLTWRKHTPAVQAGDTNWRLFCAVYLVVFDSAGVSYCLRSREVGALNIASPCI